MWGTASTKAPPARKPSPGVKEVENKLDVEERRRQIREAYARRPELGLKLDTTMEESDEHTNSGVSAV